MLRVCLCGCGIFRLLKPAWPHHRPALRAISRRCRDVVVCDSLSLSDCSEECKMKRGSDEIFGLTGVHTGVSSACYLGLSPSCSPGPRSFLQPTFTQLLWTLRVC